MRTPEPTRETILRARKGDPEAFAQIVEVFQDPIYRIAYRVSFDRDEAADLVQESFLQIYRVFDQYDPSRPFLPWCLKVAVNCCRNKMRARRRRREVSLEALGRTDDDGPTFEISAPGEDMGERSDRNALRDVIGRAVRRLPAAYRLVISLHYLQGLPYEDLAETLDLPIGTVKNRLHRARKVLERRLRPIWSTR